MRGEFYPHERGPRRFLPVHPGYAHMIKGTMAREVRWKPLPFLGAHSGFWKERRLWHLCYRGRRIW